MDSLRTMTNEPSHFVERPEWVDRWADRLTPVCEAIRWVWDRVHPEVQYVHISRSDTWSMDHTLALVTLPMLRQVQQLKQGSPFVEDSDVPEHLRSTAAPPKAKDWDIDDNHHARWDWVLGEMIWAFETLLDPNREDKFYSGESDIKWTPVDAQGNEVPRGQHRYYRMDHGPGHTLQCDQAGLDHMNKRMQNGFRLFGVYFQSLYH